MFVRDSDNADHHEAPSDSAQTEFLAECYQLLQQTYGHRHWWPAETEEEIVIGAILTQNVSWSNVQKAIGRLRRAGLLSLNAIHEEPDERLAPLLRSTRFYNVKTQRLKNFTAWLHATYSGSLSQMLQTDTTILRRQLLSVKGVGEETADTILLYVGHRPVFVIDEYTRRIIQRLRNIDRAWRYADFQAYFTRNLPQDVGLYSDYHAQLVHLGHAVCLATKPECALCPLHNACLLPEQPL